MEYEHTYSYTVCEADAGLRLDKWLARQDHGLSRSYLKQLIEQGHVCFADGNSISTSLKVKPGQIFDVNVPPPEPTHMQAANIPLDIRFEDNDMLIVNKAAGMTVHPGAGAHQDTLANALLAYCPDTLSGIGGIARPGIVHRLDKDTSGLMIIAKTDKAHIRLSDMIAKREVIRKYQAFCWGVPTPLAGTIDRNIGRHPAHRTKMTVLNHGGRTAITHYNVIEPYKQVASLVECKLQTGRTHQIRVHLTEQGHSLIGDPTYGKRRPTPRNLPHEQSQIIETFNRQALHSFYLALEHPITSNHIEIMCELPDDLKQLKNALEDLNNC